MAHFKRKRASSEARGQRFGIQQLMRWHLGAHKPPINVPGMLRQQPIQHCIRVLFGCFGWFNACCGLGGEKFGGGSGLRTSHPRKPRRMPSTASKKSCCRLPRRFTDGADAEYDEQILPLVERYAGRGRRIRTSVR